MDIEVAELSAKVVVLEDEVDSLQRENARQLLMLKEKDGIIQELSSASRDQILPVDHHYGFVMVLCAFTVQFTVLGGINSFGVFMDEFRTDSDLGRPSDSMLSVVVSIANGLTPAVGCFSGSLSDRIGPKPIQTAAGITLGAGLVVSSYCRSYPAFLVSFGMILGVAGGCTIAPGLAAIGNWFEHRRALAYGFVYAGSGAGTTLVPLLSRYLLDLEDDENEWRRPFRWLALFLAVPACVAGLVIRRRTPCIAHEPDSHLSLREIVTNRVIIVLFFVGMGYAWAFFSIIVYTVSYAQSFGEKPYENRTPIGDSSAAFLLSIFGAMSTVGSAIWGELARRLGVRRMFKVASLSTAVLMAAWPFCGSYALLACFAACSGFAIAGCVTCFPALAAEYFAGPQLGAIIAIVFLGFGIGSLAGPPATGFLAEAMDGEYTLAFLTCAAGLIMSFALVHFCLPLDECPAELLSPVADNMNRVSFTPASYNHGTDVCLLSHYQLPPTEKDTSASFCACRLIVFPSHLYLPCVIFSGKEF
ncbi:putative MFS-type transporter YbfB [Diplonema papillatum]|nr:putative MFS-type transporter YbfB [Diplonema papillatum]